MGRRFEADRRPIGPVGGNEDEVRGMGGAETKRKCRRECGEDKGQAQA